MSVIMPAFEHVSLNTMGLLWRLIGKKDQDTSSLNLCII